MFKALSYIFYLLLIIVLLLAIGIFNSTEIMIISIIAVGLIALMDAFDR